MLNIAGLDAKLQACTENSNKIWATPLLGMSKTFQNDGLTLMDGITDETFLVSGRSRRILQPGNSAAWNPTANAVTLGSRLLKTESAKVDLLIYPDQYEKTYASAMSSAQAAFTDFQAIPFAEFLYQRIVEQTLDDLKVATWKGIKTNTPTANVHLDWMDGFIRRITTARVAGNIPTYTAGTITAANVLAKVEGLADVVSKEFAGVPGFIHVPRVVYNFFAKASESASRPIIFTGTPGDMGSTYEKIMIRNTKIQLVLNDELTHGATTQMFFTTENNLFVGTDSVANNNSFRFQLDKRAVAVMADIRWATQYAMDSQNLTGGETPIIASEAFV